jgi:hypothetical protein
MRDDETSLVSSLQIVLQFLIDMIVGILLFSMIAGSSLFLSYIVKLMKAAGISDFLVQSLVYIQQAILGVDVALFVFFLARTFFAAAKGLWSRSRDI